VSAWKKWFYTLFPSSGPKAQTPCVLDSDLQSFTGYIEADPRPLVQLFHSGLPIRAIRVALASLDDCAARAAYLRSEGFQGKAFDAAYARYKPDPKLISRRTGLSIASVKRSLSLANKEIPIVDNDLLERIPNHRKAVQLHRAIYRHLLKHGSKAEWVVFLGQSFWCVYPKHRNGDRLFRSAGKVKASGIADLFGITERSVKRGRRELVKIGAIVPVPGQRGRNRRKYGKAYRLDLGWSSRCLTLSPHSVGGCLTLSPSIYQDPSPKERKITTSNPKDSDAPAPTQTGEGPGDYLFKPRKKKNTMSDPRLSDIRDRDLSDIDRLEELHHQAAEAYGFPSHDFLLFCSMAEHARRCGDRPGALFRVHVREWQTHRAHPSQSDEDQARQKIVARDQARAKARGPLPGAEGLFKQDLEAIGEPSSGDWVRFKRYVRMKDAGARFGLSTIEVYSRVDGDHEGDLRAWIKVYEYKSVQAEALDGRGAA